MRHQSNTAKSAKTFLTVYIAEIIEIQHNFFKICLIKSVYYWQLTTLGLFSRMFHVGLGLEEFYMWISCLLDSGFIFQND